MLLPIIRDPRLTALDKFHRYAEASSRIKAGRQELIIGMLRTWYSDENVLVRHKVTDATLKYTAPMILEPIIRQGIAENTFDTRYPESAARIIAGIFLSLADSVAGLLFLDASAESVARRAGEVMDATTDSIERILGAPPELAEVRATEGTLEDYRQVSAGVLLMRGGKAEPLITGTLDALHRVLPANDVVVLPGLHHGSAQDQDSPQTIADALRQFLHAT